MAIGVGVPLPDGVTRHGMGLDSIALYCNVLHFIALLMLYTLLYYTIQCHWRVHHLDRLICAAWVHRR